MIRLAEERDVEGIAQLYRDVYGDDYPFTCFYDTAWIKRGVFDKEIRWYVAEDPELGLLGSSAIMLRAGDADDQVGEIGRLVVHPRARGRQLGTLLVRALTKEAHHLCDFAFAECRTAHVGSQIIFDREGYRVVGIEPLVYKLGEHESVTFVCILSEGARILRKPQPAVIPEAYELASRALAALELPSDVTVSDAAPYPTRRDADMRLEPMDAAARYRLLRMARGAVLAPDVFGAMRLEHGHLKLEPAQARHLVLQRDETVLGGLGYTWDGTDRKLRIFEFAAVDDHAKGTLATRALAWLEATYDPRYLVIDVSAYSPSMQATMHGLGFAPVAYAPSMVYSLGERFDVVRMVKLRMDPDLSSWELTEVSEATARLAERALLEVQKGSLRGEVMRHVPLFEGLTDAQLAALRRRCRLARFEKGEVVFGADSPEQALLVVHSGEIDVVAGGEVQETLGAGRVFGEEGLVAALPQRMGAVARTDAEVLVMSPDDFDELVARDPDAGVAVLRRLAASLARRL